MKRLAILMVTTVLPAIFILFLIVKFPAQNFNGGWNPIAFSYAMWEQITGVMIMAAMLCIAKFKWNTPSTFMSWLSANAFAVYIFHPIVLVTLSLLVQSWTVDPVVKLLVVAPSAVALSFIFASVIRKIPFVSSII